MIFKLIFLSLCTNFKQINFMKTNYICSFLVAFILALGTGISQTTLIDETFRDGAAPTEWTPNEIVFETGAGGYARFSDLTASLNSPSFDASAFGQIEINFDNAKFGSGDDGPMTVQVSTDGGENFSTVGVSELATSSTYVSTSLVVSTLSDDMVIRFSRPDSPSEKRFRDLQVIASGAPSAGPGQIELTYSSGNIPVSGSTFNPDCSNAFLDVEVPAGSVITSVDVAYQVNTTNGGGWTSEQRSRLVINGGAVEGDFLNCNAPGSTGNCGSVGSANINYNREGLTFAQGETGTVTFELQVYGLWPSGPYCNEQYHFIPNNTWTITVNYVDEPDCGALTGLTVVDNTDTSVDLAWSAATGVVNYNWAIYTQGSVVGTDTPAFEGATPNETLTVTGLNSNTSYFAVVQAECAGEELGLPSQPAPFKTDCGAQSGDFLENFNTTPSGQIPDCWSKITNSTSSVLFDVVGFGPAFSAPNNLRANSSQDANTEHFLISPVQTDLDGGRRIAFYGRQTALASTNTIEVGSMSDSEDETTFTSFETFTLSGTVYAFYFVDVPDTVTDEHFALKVSFSGTFQTVYIDNISYEATPPCDFIDGLVVDSFDQNTVDFSWNALPNAVSYDWEVYAANDVVGTDTPVAEGNSSTNSATATGLEPNTSYFVVVSGDCGPDDGTGVNSAPASFTTLCEAFSFPFGENFEDVDTSGFPACWLRLDTAVTTGAFNVTTFSAPILQGTKQFQSSSGNNDSTVRFLISPELSDLSDNDKRVTFLARTSNTVANNATIALGIMDNPNDPTSFIEIESWILTTTPTLYQGDIDFAFTEAHFAIRFSYAANFVTSLVDDIQYFEVPACDVPQDVINEDLSFTTADFSWNAVSSAESYNWVVVAQGGDPSEVDDVVASGNSTTTETTVEELTAEAPYQFYVKSDCDALGEGEFSQPVSFYTGYCVPSTAQTGDFITNFTTTDALTNVSIVKNAISPAGYGNFSQNEIITVFPGSSFNFSNTHNFANNNVGIWVDWNEDLIFESTEQVFVGGDTVNPTETGTISIPSDLELGSYRMRVRARWGQTPVGACGDENFSEALDFTILVVEEPDCLAPSDIVIDDVTTDTVNFSWAEVVIADSYEWEIYNAASIVGEDTPVDSGVAVDANASSTELNANTPYKVVVKSICGEDSESLFSSAVNFRTECGPVSASFNEGFEDTAPGQIPFCWNRILDFTAGTPLVEVTNFSVPVFGSRQIRFVSSSDANADLILVSPELADLDGTPKRVTFFARQLTATQTNSLDVGTMTDPDDATTFEVVQTINFSGNTMQFFAVNFLDVTTETHFAFRPTFSNTFQNILLDEVTYEEIPACDVVLNVSGSPSSSSSADFSWNDVFGAESYDWIIVLAGDDPSEASNILQTGNVEEAEVTVGDLEINESYDFYVSANCGDEGAGALSDPATVSISVCVEGVGPTSLFDTNIQSVELLGEAGTSLLIEDNCPAQTGVQLELNQEVLVIPGGSYELSIDHGSCSNSYYNRRGKVWVDFDQSLSFDEDEVIGSFQNAATTSVENALLDLEIPTDLDFGTYRMRVVIQETTVEVTNPCNSFIWGNVIDFLITVVDPDDLPLDLEPAPTPTEDESLVLSCFSNAYDDVPVNTWLTSWSQAQLEDIQIQGVDTKLYTNLDFAGVEMTGVNSIDLEAAQMTKFHVDLLTPNMTTVRVKLVDFGPDNAFGGGDDTEHEIVLSDLVIGEWNSLEVELSQFEGLINTANISQLILSGLVDGVAGLGTLYVDNVYFSKASLSSDDFNSINFSYYPNPVKSHLNIQSASTVEKVEVYNVLGQRVLLAKPNTTNPSIEMGNLNAGVYLMNVSVNGTQKTFQVIKE